MNVVDLSVIVPFFNTGSYLPNCVESLVWSRGDLHDEIEIILVDDGSTDGSTEIALRYSRDYPNVQYFRQENAGPGAARNLGIDRASGTYIAFVDSDDFVQGSLMAKTVELIRRDCVGVIAFDLYAMDDGRSETLRPMLSFSDCIAVEGGIEPLSIAMIMGIAPWGFAYPSGCFAAEEGFPSGKSEDLALVPLLKARSLNVMTLEQESGCGYVHVARDGSVSEMCSEADYREVFQAGKLLVERAKRSGVFDRFRDEIEFLAIRYLLFGISLSMSKTGRSGDLVQEIDSYMMRTFESWSSNPFLRKKLVRYFIPHFKVKLWILSTKKYSLYRALYQVKERLWS